jgi:signal transduction histidine kinase/CheY-like chemotaxis protein
VRAEQARTLYRNCPVGVLGAGAGALLLASGFGLSGRADVGLATLWSGLMVGCVAAHLLLCVLYWRADPPDLAWRRWLGLFTLVAGIEGLVWFCGAFWMGSPTDLNQELIVLLVSSVVASGAVPVFGAYVPTYAAFFFPTILPHLGFALLYGYPLHWLMAGMIVAYLVAMPLIARVANEQLVESLRLRFENIDLIEDLRLQKEVADQANRAKSQFLAAASHDLRQPIHALGLFIAALRGRAMDAEGQQLVDHIDQSVGAMDDLFTSLLDISKLDAGVVHATLEPVAVGPMLERLCREHAAEAGAKGVRLVWAPCSAVVMSDPVLLERALRNILANAVRYTDVGRVLVGARRAGASMRIEVWDTGRGIAAGQQEAVFQEFYQVGNPERDRSKGLGLGLAIVRRVLPLIHGDLALTSEPGRGSVFRLNVPMAAKGTEVAAESPAAAEGAPGGLILVVDDEIAIQTAMSALLTRWGYRVVVAGSGEEMMQRVAETAGEGRERPDLLICDYRLRGGDNGADVIRSLQGHFGADIPAMLITGDTAPDRIAEAQASGFLLLHKPVPNGRLRTAIGNLMRAGQAGG